MSARFSLSAETLCDGAVVYPRKVEEDARLQHEVLSIKPAHIEFVSSDLDPSFGMKRTCLPVDPSRTVLPSSHRCHHDFENLECHTRH